MARLSSWWPSKPRPSTAEGALNSRLITKALTVSFGLGMGATVHFLNRLRLEEPLDEGPGADVERATMLVGPALILTSMVLSCGLVVTVLSDLLSLRLFGWLSALAVLLAPVGDLTILRPTIMVLRLRSRRYSDRSSA